MGLYITQGPDSDERIDGCVGKMTQEACQALHMEMLEVLNRYPAWLTRVNPPENIVLMCISGLYEAWAAINKDGEIEVLGICGWEKHPLDKFYHVVYLGGKNLKTYFKEGIRVLEQYVYEMGGSEVIVHGRQAWLKLLAREGYGQTDVQLRKNVRRKLGN